MKCPECFENGLKSIVTQTECYSTSTYISPQWDEDGNKITPKTIITMTAYSCSNGHSWKEEL